MILRRNGYSENTSKIRIIPSDVKIGNSNITINTAILFYAVQLKAIINIGERAISNPIKIAINDVLIKENIIVQSKNTMICKGILSAKSGYSKLCIIYYI